MKALFCTIKKLPARGDDIRLCYTHKMRGGMTEAACTVDTAVFWRELNNGEDIAGRETWVETYDPDREPIVRVRRSEDESKSQIIAALARVISEKWTGTLFSCKARGGELVLTSLDDETNFFPMLNGRVEDGWDFIEIDQT